MEFKDIVKKRREELGLTLEEVGLAVGVSKTTIQRYESGNIQNIRRDKINALAKVLQISPGVLMGWDDWDSTVADIFPNWLPGEFINDSHPDNIIPLPKTKMIPLVGTIACGKPILADENIETMISMPEYINADFALRCKGDSMIGARILDNDIVYIRKQEIVENGEIAAVLINEEATLKRFYRYGDTIVLRAENPTVKELEYKNEEINNLKILGKAIYFLSQVN